MALPANGTEGQNADGHEQEVGREGDGCTLPEGDRDEKGQMLNELVTLMGYHRSGADARRPFGRYLRIRFEQRAHDQCRHQEA